MDVMFKGLLGEKDDVVDVNNNIFKNIEHFHHVALEDIGRWHTTLRKAGVNVTTPWKNDSTELLGRFVEDEMIVSTVEIKAGGKRETLNFPNNFVDERQMDRLANETLVQLTKAGKETNSSILLWAKEARGSPFGIDVGLKDTDVAELLNFLASNVDDGMGDLVSP